MHCSFFLGFLHILQCTKNGAPSGVCVAVQLVYGYELLIHSWPVLFIRCSDGMFLFVSVQSDDCRTYCKKRASGHAIVRIQGHCQGGEKRKQKKKKKKEKKNNNNNNNNNNFSSLVHLLGRDLRLLSRLLLIWTVSCWRWRLGLLGATLSFKRR
jgi:hypothetical protein